VKKTPKIVLDMGSVQEGFNAIMMMADNQSIHSGGNGVEITQLSEEAELHLLDEWRQIVKDLTEMQMKAKKDIDALETGVKLQISQAVKRADAIQSDLALYKPGASNSDAKLTTASSMIAGPSKPKQVQKFTFAGFGGPK
jgi:hypothetical protein